MPVTPATVAINPAVSCEYPICPTLTENADPHPLYMPPANPYTSMSTTKLRLLMAVRVVVHKSFSLNWVSSARMSMAEVEGGCGGCAGK